MVHKASRFSITSSMAGPKVFSTNATRKKRAPRVMTDSTMNSGRLKLKMPAAMVISL